MLVLLSLLPVTSVLIRRSTGEGVYDSGEDAGPLCRHFLFLYRTQFAGSGGFHLLLKNGTLVVCTDARQCAVK